MARSRSFRYTRGPPPQPHDPRGEPVQMTGEQWKKYFESRGERLCLHCGKPHKIGSYQEVDCEYHAKHSVVDDGSWARMWGED